MIDGMMSIGQNKPRPGQVMEEARSKDRAPIPASCVASRKAAAACGLAALMSVCGLATRAADSSTSTPAQAAHPQLPTGLVEVGTNGPPQAKESWDTLLDNDITRAFTQGKFSLNARLRWEHADQEGLKASDAVTIRPRFGFTTAPLYGFQGMLEGENVTSLGLAYNDAGLHSDETDRTVIADPEATEVNQAWLSYARWESLLRFGRQRIVLDNHRFVGDVGWRQNMQTYDAIVARTDFIPQTTLFYGYIDRINRVLGDDHPQGNWDSDSHLVNASYAPCDFAKFTAYGYFLDLDDSPANSSSTAGASLSGKARLSQEVQLNYLAEVAWQTDAADNPNSYDAPYYAIECSAKWNRYLAGLGYEVLGSDGGETAFRTPLATLHKFNGWADVFLVTPNDGLQDFWVQGGVDLPLQIPFRVVYHKFWSEQNGRDFGQEMDAVVSHQFGKYFTTLAKYAFYDGSSAFDDIHRFWLELAFDY